MPHPRNRLKYALTYKEVTTILMQRVVKVDGKIRMDKCFPCGIMGDARDARIARRSIVYYSFRAFARHDVASRSRSTD